MAPRTNPAPQTPAVQTTPTTPAPSASAFSFEVGDYAAGKQRPSSKVPDEVADLLEDLRSVYDKEAKDAKGNVIPAGMVKFKTVTVPAEHAKVFAKHVRSYSKTIMYPQWSARLSQLSDTTFRVGVGPVKPKPRRAKTAETPAAMVAEKSAEKAADKA